MPFTQEFLKGRREHLVAKLRVTKEALLRTGLPNKHIDYKLDEHIPDIEAAIQRIDSPVTPNRYGYCQSCEEPIPEARLLDHPHVRRCVPCENLHEKGRVK